MKILAIETSCDETAVAVGEDTNILSSMVSSQVPIHKKYGGVVPEIAARHHLKNIIPLLRSALDEAKVTLMDIDVIGVTQGPGLVGALLIGISLAKSIAYTLNIPLVGVNHLQGHIYANFIDNPDLTPPLLALVVSGGHTELVYQSDWGKFEVMGSTRDDAAGEAFDKVSRLLNLGYPGGPAIQEAAKRGKPDAIPFPRPLLDKGFDFSFSGLKTSVLYYTRAHRDYNSSDVAASFQEAIVDVLIAKTIKAAKAKRVRRVVLAGGVAANERLRQKLKKALLKEDFALYLPSLALCIDNAAMIERVAYEKALKNEFASLDMNAVSNLDLASRHMVGEKTR